MSEGTEPELLSSIEGMDEDELRVDPLEEGVEPPERWAAADKFGMTPAEQREGPTLDQRLGEEEADAPLAEVPERPVAATPAEDLDESVENLADDVESESPEDVETVPAEIHDAVHVHPHGTPEVYADEAGGAYADTIRTPPEGRDTLNPVPGVTANARGSEEDPGQTVGA